MLSATANRVGNIALVAHVLGRVGGRMSFRCGVPETALLYLGVGRPRRLRYGGHVQLAHATCAQPVRPRIARHRSGCSRRRRDDIRSLHGRAGDRAWSVSAPVDARGRRSSLLRPRRTRSTSRSPTAPCSCHRWPPLRPTCRKLLALAYAASVRRYNSFSTGNALPRRRVSHSHVGDGVSSAVVRYASADDRGL